MTCALRPMLNILKKLDIGSEKYPALTGIRAVGASVVFFDHCSPWPDRHITINVMAFFFLLSGFLIVRIYYEKLQLSPEWLAKYFINRFARIYPVYFLLLSVAVIWGPAVSGGVLLKNYTLTHALFHGTPLIIQPSWTLTVEECFYFLAPLFMVVARRRRFAAAFLVACLMFVAALWISRLGGTFLAPTGFMLNSTFFGHFVEFFGGVWLALTIIRLEENGAPRGPGRWQTLLGVIGVCALCGVMMLIYSRPHLNTSAITLINNFLIPAPIALLYLGLIREDTPLARVLSSGTAGLLGRSSYAFYLLHALVIEAAAALLPPNSPRLLIAVGLFFLTWILAIALFVGFEEPVNIFIRRKFRSKEGWVGLQATLFQVRN
jgi:peptidoglycan/LPS O-acetylase OafA/YrhL